MYQPSALRTPRPAFTQTLKASANTPSGAAHKTQRTTMTVVSASVWNRSIAWARRRGSIRVNAKPNNSAQRTKGNIAACAAAAMTLLGMIVANRWANPADASAAGGVPMAARKDAINSGSRGSSESWNGANTAANVAPAQSRTRKTTMARRAVRPDTAASLVDATPRITSATTSGTTLICNAFNHRLPMGCATAATSFARSGWTPATTMPRVAPPNNAISTRTVGDMAGDQESLRRCA